MIVERFVELEPEWRRRPSEELERADVTAGADVTLHDFGLGSKFGISADLPPSWRARLRRMQLWQRRSRASSWSERSLREVLLELDKLCEDLALPKSVRAEISYLYRKARAARLVAGRETNQVLAALTFITCRSRALPRTESEVTRALVARSGLGEKEALRNLRQLTKLLARELGIKIPRVSADDYINRFAPQLGLSRRVVERAHELNKALPKGFKQAKPPLLLAAISLYLGAEMTGERITLQKVASTLGVGVSSISKNLARVREFADR